MDIIGKLNALGGEHYPPDDGEGDGVGGHHTGHRTTVHLTGHICIYIKDNAAGPQDFESNTIALKLVTL